jgi:hypothetical protein
LGYAAARGSGPAGLALLVGPARKPIAGAGPLARGRPRGLREAFPFIIFSSFSFFYFLLPNLFTITSYILNGYTPKQNIIKKQIYFRMMHQSLFPYGFINIYNWSKISYYLERNK